MPDTTPSRPAMTMREIRDRLGHVRPDTTPAPFQYIDEDGFCLSARLLPDLNNGGTTNTVSITIEGSDEPQSAHVPVNDLPQVLAGIATAARLVLGTTDQQPATVLDGLEPVQLRWGLDDVMYGDDDTTVLLSGPNGEPYWVEMDPERTAALRDALAGPGQPETTPDDRRARYAAALARVLLDSAGRLIPNHIAETVQAVSHSVDAVMAVADAEQAALRAEAEGLDEALRGLISASEKDGARLRADLAVGIRAAADEIAGIDFHPKARARSLDIATGLVHRLRRLADEAQQPETEAHPAQTEWIGEVLELDDTWEYLGASPDRSVAEKRRASITRRHPDAQTRTVRKTTTYTVAEDES